VGDGGRGRAALRPHRRYEFKKCLGKGGFGDVWLAIEVATGKKVAVKKMSLENQSRAMVEQEVSALRRCGIHPNVGTLIEVLWVKPDAEDRNTQAYLVMELATGGGMFERLVSEGAYTEKLASAMMQQVARAIYHLHSRGIIHRDIKPENIVFETAEPGSEVQVIDFGTAVILRRRTQRWWRAAASVPGRTGHQRCPTVCLTTTPSICGRWACSCTSCSSASTPLTRAAPPPRRRC